MTHLDGILKSRDITLPTKVHLFKAIVFPAVMYGCESWAIKRAEHQRIDAFESILVLQKTLESSLDFKESKPVHPKGNKSWIYIGHIDAEAPILRPPDMKSWFIWKGILGKIEGRRRKGQQRMRWMDGNTDSRDMGFSKLQEWWTGKPGVLQSMGLQRTRTRLSNWTVLHAWYAFWPVICLSCTLE